jgi:uncharacterized protein YeeX (DUF496 family)
MAVNSSNNPLMLMSSKAKNGAALVNEKIDERILRLLGLVDVFDIDYDTYISLLKERMAAARMAKKTLATEEVEMITNEFKRVKGKKGKGRFKVKKITADTFKKGTAAGINLKKQKLLPGVKPLALPPTADKLGGKGPIQEIIDSLGEIIKSLSLQNRLQKQSAEKSRKDEENAKRKLSESNLEKGFSAAIKVAEKVVAPIKSLLQRIIDFFLAIFLGRLVVKLLEWFSNKDNQDKIKSIGRFLGDHWPKLLALYLRFGTGLGRFVGGLSKLVIAGTLKLVQLAARLVGAKGVARFLGGRGGKLLGAGLTVATTVGTTMALSSGIENFAGLDNMGSDPEKAKFSGGGFANFKKLFGYFGGGPGFVSGQKGIDKIPAMLSDGEFVMSRGAVQKYGVDTLESMNAAGGGTNRPKVVQGTTYAAGGGYVGTQDDKKEKVDDKILKKREKELDKISNAAAFGNYSDVEMDTNNSILINARLKRIESQMQSQRALASGKGVNLQGASFGGVQLGTGYGAKYQGRDSIVIKGGAKNFSTGIGDKEITLAGKRYFAQKRGNDVIYSVAKAGGSLVGGAGLKSVDKKKLPPTQIMMGGDGKPFIGFLSFDKGNPVYRRGADPGTGTTNPLEALGRFLNPNAYKDSDKKTSAQKFREGATNSLDYYRKQGMSEDAIKRQMKSLGQDYDKAKNDLEYRNKRPDLIKQGKLSPSGKQLSSREKMRAKISSSQKKPSVPAPPQKPKVVVKSTYSGGQRGSGSKPSTGGRPKTPNFGATCPSSNAPKNKKILGIF